MLWPSVILFILFGAMSTAWVTRRRGAASGWIDATWSAAVGVAGIVAALSASGSGGRKALIAGVVFVWSARLALHIGERARTGGDDPRYLELERSWGAAAGSRLWLFLQIQAAAGAVLVGAVALAAAAPARFPSRMDALGLILCIVGWIVEGVSDAQLRAFAWTSGACGTVCDVGLWRWSRHPNYVGEWLIWCGVAVIAAQAPIENPLGLLALAAPVLMYVSLAHVSGAPLLEAHMLASRGQAYRDYQRRAPAFFPRLRPTSFQRRSSKERVP